MRDVPPFRLGTQEAQVFNQPLSFDTSSVTDIHDMFKVRLAHSRARCRPHRDILLSVSHASSAPQHTLPAAQCAIRSTPLVHSTFAFQSAQQSPFRLCTQKSMAFNQPLSFDTSRVTNMGSMFEVCARARVCALCRPTHPTSLSPACCGSIPTIQPHNSIPTVVFSYSTALLHAHGMCM